MPTGGVRVRLEQAEERSRRLKEWGRDLAAELAVLPQTLASWREGVDNFQRVAKRLADATQSLEQVTRVQTDAMKTMRDQLAATPGGERMAGAFGDINETLGGLARLNPFWPRVPPRSGG
jgi:hypothetical protein